MNVRINRIIRALSSSNLYTPMSSLYKKLNLLKLKDLYKVELGKFMYLYYNKKTPKIFNSFFKKVTEIHSYNTRQVSHSTFFLPRMSKTCTQCNNILESISLFLIKKIKALYFKQIKIFWQSCIKTNFSLYAN